MVSSSFLSPDLMDVRQGVIPDHQSRSDTSLVGLVQLRVKPVEQKRPTVLRGATSAVEPLPPVLSGDSQPSWSRYTTWTQR